MQRQILQSPLLNYLGNIRQKTEENRQAKNLFAIEFDPDLAFGKEGNKQYINRGYLDAVNQIIGEQGLPKVKFDKKSTFTINKTVQSKDLDDYNLIYDMVENQLNQTSRWKNNVPFIAKEKTVSAWTNHMYGLLRGSQKQISGFNQTQETKDRLNELYFNYFELLKPDINRYAREEFNQFENSKRDGVSKGFVDLQASLSAGIELNAGDLFDTDFGAWAEDLRKKSEDMSEAQGFGSMTTEELFQSGEYVQSGISLLTNAWSSLPQQLPSIFSSVTAAAGSRFIGPLAARGGALTTALGVGYLQESGNFILDVTEEYHRARSRAKRLKTTMLDPNNTQYNPKKFQELFGVSITPLNTKTIDQMTDDEIRQASEGIAQRYGVYSTLLEAGNTVGDAFLGKYTRTLRTINDNNPKAVAKAFFKKMFKNPYVNQSALEGATEGLQETVSEIMKQDNIPEYTLSWAKIMESGAIGGIFGFGQQTISSNLIPPAKSISDIELSPEEVASQQRTTTEMSVERAYDREIIVGFASNPNALEQIAERHNVSIDEVRIRMSELNVLNQLDISNAKSILTEGTSILDDYGWDNPFPVIKETITDTGQDIDDLGQLPNEGTFFNEPTMPEDIEAGLGLDLLNGNQEIAVEQREINRIDEQIQKLNDDDNVNNIASNEKRAKLLELNQKREELLKSLDRGTIQKNREKKIIEKQQKESNAPVIGQEVIIRTPVLQGTKGKVIGTLEKQGRNNIMVVSTSMGMKKIKIDNLSFISPTDNITSFQQSLKGFKPTKKKPVVQPKPKPQSTQKLSTQQIPHTVPENSGMSKNPFEFAREIENRPSDVDVRTKYALAWVEYSNQRPAVKTAKKEALKNIKKLEDIKVGATTSKETVNQAKSNALELKKRLQIKTNQEKGIDNFIDPENPEIGRTIEPSIDDLENLIIKPTDKDTPVTNEVITDQEAKDIVLGFTGENVNELFDEDINDIVPDDDDITLDNRKDIPTILYTGKAKKKLDSNFQRLWNTVKNMKKLDDTAFGAWVDKTDPIWEKTVYAENWRLWSEEKLNTSQFKKHLEQLYGKISRGAGDVFEDLTTLDDDFRGSIQESIEAIRENTEVSETDLEKEPISVKDYSKIASEFFTRYNFRNLTPEKMQAIYDAGIKLIETDPQNAYEGLLTVLSSEEFDLVTPEGQTLGELVLTNETPRRLFRRFFNAIHPSNTGTANRGLEGEIVNWEVIMLNPSTQLKDVFTDEGRLRAKTKLFRPTSSESINGQKRPEIGNKRLYTRFVKDSIYSMLQVSDVYRSYKWQKHYGFLNAIQMYNLYRDDLVKNNLVPISSRGEDGSLIFASVNQKAVNASLNLKQFLTEEMNAYGRLNKKQKDTISKTFLAMVSEKYMTDMEKQFFDYVFKGDFNRYRQHLITKHYALKNLFGKDYIFMNPETIMKRIKIPFTPVTTSPSLPERKVMYFDADGATINYIPFAMPTGQGQNEITIPLKQIIDGESQYIGDGTTITSEYVFAVDYPKHFGSEPNAKRAKTVQYNIDGDNVHAAKHQEMTMYLREEETAVIRDKSGQDIAMIYRDNDGLVNVYTIEGERIDYLMSDDEAKIHSGDYAEYNKVHVMPGESVGMILFSPEKQKNIGKFSTQLSYYFEDPRFQDFIMNKYDTVDQGSYSPKNLANYLLELNQDPLKIKKALEEFSTRYYDVVPQNVEELGALGVGRHPAIQNFLKDILKKKVLSPMLAFQMKGSYLDFRADYRKLVSDTEMMVGDNPALLNEIMQRAKKKIRFKQDKINFANEWLKQNKIYGMVVRNPVASSVGFGLYRVKEIDAQLSDSFIVSPKEVKERFEGDQDHDTAHTLWLDEEMYKALKPHLQPTKGLNLSQYARDVSKNSLENLSSTIGMVRNMTYGQTAISEVVNMSRYAGALNNIFGKEGSLTYKVNDEIVTIKPRPLDMIVKDGFIKYKNGKTWEGEFRELLRLHLQAAVDHPKVLLLKEWGYERNKILNYLFYNPKNPNQALDANLLLYINDTLINRLLRLNSIIDNQKTDGAKAVKFDELFKMSIRYSEFVNNRKQGLYKLYEDFKEESKSSIGIGPSPYNNVSFVGAKFPKGKNVPTSLQEKISVQLAEVINRVPGKLSRFFTVDYEYSLAVHEQSIRAIKDEVLQEINELSDDTNRDFRAGQIYAQNLGTNIEALFEKRKNKGETGNDLSFLQKMNARTWDYSQDFINFYNQWSRQYDKLNDAQKKSGTLAYLIGVIRGDKSSVRADLRSMPPVKREGRSTLDPQIIQRYFEEYNKILSKAYKDVSYLTQIRKNPTVSQAQIKKELGCGK